MRSALLYFRECVKRSFLLHKNSVNILYFVHAHLFATAGKTWQNETLQKHVEQHIFDGSVGFSEVHCSGMCFSEQGVFALQEARG